MQKKQPPKLFLLMFFMIGFYFFIVGVLPINIELIPYGTQMQGQIHRKSMLPPFRNIDIVVPNVKQAIIATSRGSKGNTTYRVELEDFQRNRVPVTSAFSSGYGEKQGLQSRINDAIKNRYQYKYTFRQPFFMLFGFVFMFGPLMALIFSKKSNVKTYRQSYSQNKSSMENPIEKQRPQDFSIPHQTEQPKSEQEKYKNINDSIIK